MGKTNIGDRIVLTVAPSRYGLGFAVFHGPSMLLDRGTRGFKNLKNKNTHCLQKVAELIEMYRPDVVVVEDYKGEGSRRCARIEQLIQNISVFATRKHVPVDRYSRSQIRECFAEFNAQTKQEIAEAIGKALPEVKPLVPAPLRIWQKERARMSVFDAIALAFTYFYFQSKKKTDE